MASVPSSVMNVDTNIQRLLLNNPKLKDDNLRGAIECNLIGFTGKVSVRTKPYKFAAGIKEARVIYITPYGEGKDLVINLRRFLVGVKFQGDKGDENRITNYVLGKLEYNDPDHGIAKEETDAALKAGKRLELGVTKDDIAINFEKDQEACTII